VATWHSPQLAGCACCHLLPFPCGRPELPQALLRPRLWPWRAGPPHNCGTNRSVTCWASSKSNRCDVIHCHMSSSSITACGTPQLLTARHIPVDSRWQRSAARGGGAPREPGLSTNDAAQSFGVHPYFEAHPHPPPPFTSSVFTISLSIRISPFRPILLLLYAPL
jgi:hypothetical protein